MSMFWADSFLKFSEGLLVNVGPDSQKHTLINRSESSFLAVIKALAELDLGWGAATKVDASSRGVDNDGCRGSLRLSSGDGNCTTNRGGSSIGSNGNRDFSLDEL